MQQSTLYQSSNADGIHHIACQYAAAPFFGRHADKSPNFTSMHHLIFSWSACDNLPLPFGHSQRCVCIAKKKFQFSYTLCKNIAKNFILLPPFPVWQAVLQLFCCQGSKILQTMFHQYNIFAFYWLFSVNIHVTFMCFLEE